MSGRRGGARPGSGRKKKPGRQRSFYCEEALGIALEKEAIARGITFSALISQILAENIRRLPMETFPLGHP